MKMKRILLPLLLVLYCTVTTAQKKSEVLEKLKETITEYFLPDFNDAIENSAWRTSGLINASSVYIEPNHFFRNGKVCTSYADWVNQYCSQSLHGRIIEHSLALNETLQKVSGNNDLYRVEATLLRRWVDEQGPSIPDEKIKITFLWRGTGHLVHIMHLDGDMSPIKLPEPVLTHTPQQTEATTAVTADQTDYISDSSIIGYFFEEFLAETIKDKMKIVYATAIIFIILLIVAVWESKEKWGPLFGISELWESLKLACWCTLALLFFAFGICSGSILAYNMYKGKHKPHRIRLEHVEAYDSYRLAVPHKAVAVAKDGKWGLINFMGRVIQPLELDSISDFYGSHGIFHSKGQYGLYDINHKEIYEWFDSMTPVRNGYALIKKVMGKDNTVYNLMNLNEDAEKLFTYLPYDYIDFQLYTTNPGIKDRYEARKDEKRGIIDGRGNVIVPLEYDYIGSFSEGLAVVVKTTGKTSDQRWDNRKCGYIDLDGKVVIPLKFKIAREFSEGLAAVKNENYKVGYINKQGKLVIPHRFIDGGKFKKGRAVVRANIYGGPWGAIDRQGNWIVKPEHQNPNEAYNALPN